MLLSYDNDCFSVNCIRSFDAVTEMVPVQASILACEDSLQMVRARAAVEECHARNLTKIASMELRYYKGSLQDSMDQLKVKFIFDNDIPDGNIGFLFDLSNSSQSDIKHKAKQHVVLAENITQDIYEPILDLKTQLLSRQKSLLTQYANIKRDMKKLEDNYLKSWTAFDKAYADAHYQWTVCKATGVSEPFLTPDMFKDLQSSSSSSSSMSTNRLQEQEKSMRTSPHRVKKTKSTLKITLSGVTSSISGISPASWMSTATAASSPVPTSGSTASTTSSSTSSSGSVLTFAVGSNLLSSALSSSSSTLNAIVNKNLTGKDLLDWAINSANNIATGADTPITTTTTADTTHTTAVAQLQHAERLRRKCLEHWQVLVNATQRAAIKVQIILTKLQGMVETFQILMSEYLKKLVVFECSTIANQQYDLQMLFKVFESVDIEADLVGFMSQNDSAFQPSEYPTLSEMISTVTPPSQLPPPPCATLLACPVTKSAPYVKEDEKVFAMRLPLLVRPLVPLAPQSLPSSSSSSNLSVQQQQQKQQSHPSHPELLHDEQQPSQSTERSMLKSNTTNKYGQAEDVLKCLIELSNSLRKQKGLPSPTLPPPPLPPPPLPDLTTSKNNNNSNNTNTSITVADNRITTSSMEISHGMNNIHSSQSQPPVVVSSSFMNQNNNNSSHSDIDSSEGLINNGCCSGRSIESNNSNHGIPMSLEIVSVDNHCSLVANSTSVAVPTTLNNNTDNKSMSPYVQTYTQSRPPPSTPEVPTLPVDNSLLNHVDENDGNDIDEVDEEDITEDHEKEETDPLWTLPSKSLVMSKENLITCIQSPVFSDAKLLQALALPRITSPSTTRSLGNLDGIDDEEIKDQDDAAEREDDIL